MELVLARLVLGRAQGCALRRTRCGADARESLCVIERSQSQVWLISSALVCACHRRGVPMACAWREHPLLVLLSGHGLSPAHRQLGQLDC